MPTFTVDTDATPREALGLSARVRALHEEVLHAPPALCIERALLVTRHAKAHVDDDEAVVVQKARSLAHVLRHKSARIYERELLVGCFTSSRVGGGMFPELHGLVLLEDLLVIDRREVNPLRLSWPDRLRLVGEVVPFWASRNLPARVFESPLRTLAFLKDQLDPTLYLINETGGISHVVPNYEGLLRLGTRGYRRSVAERRRGLSDDPDGQAFLDAVDIALEGLEAFADRYRAEATRLAQSEHDPLRRAELIDIAEVCARVPREPASTFREALQSLLFAQIALNLESLDNSVCPGRLDRILWPYYAADREAGRLEAADAFELLGCFAVKLCEIVPAFSRRITRFHGGLFNGQVVVVGGTDEDGRDSVNELSYLFLELMDRLRTRQPNYSARIHPGSPARYRRRIAAALAAGAVSPALYNDAAIVPLMVSRGVRLDHARDYANVGCVEPVPTTRAFFSTDAALVNLPLCLELALNEGRRFGDDARVGAKTAPIEEATSLDEVISRFAAQVERVIARLLDDLCAVERANARLHPTALTSALLEGCIESATDCTAGGAMYNGSGVQGVGAVEVGDSFAALEHVVFSSRRASLRDVVDACAAGFIGVEGLRARLLRAPKYGNDDPRADRLVGRVMHIFADALRGRQNTRGGEYVAGFYSVTSHQAFGEVTGALPSGREPGTPFSSGISPSRGQRGPTAALRSQAALPLGLAKNGVNFNLELPPWTLVGDAGTTTLAALVDGAFAEGCMQMQVNVLDPAVLVEAMCDPEKHRGLLVRVSGYSAYFVDLSKEMQQELIDRMVPR